MARARFTDKRLKAEIDEINENLAEKGALIRFEWKPRNGYSACDEYDVDSEGNRSHSGSRNVGCGSPREVNTFAWERYYQIVNGMERLREIEKLEQLQRENAGLREKLTKSYPAASDFVNCVVFYTTSEDPAYPQSKRNVDFVRVECTKEQREMGEHLTAVEDWCRDRGGVDPMIVMDNSDLAWPSILKPNMEETPILSVPYGL